MEKKWVINKFNFSISNQPFIVEKWTLFSNLWNKIFEA